MSIIAAGTSSGTALVSTGDTDGNLVIKTTTSLSVLTTAATFGTDQSLTVVGPTALSSTLGITGATTFTAARGTVTTDNDGSFSMNAGSNFLCTPTAGFTLTFTNITAGQSGNILLVNGSAYAIAAAATTKVASTTLATISATGTYWLSYYSPDGTNVYVAATGALA